MNKVLMISLLLLLVVPVVAQDDQVDCRTPLEIWQVQGAGSEANCVRKRVTLNENIVTAVGDYGFFMQTPAHRSDNDPLTSDGVYVKTSFPPASWGVEVGAIVSIDGGRVAEEYDLTQIELSAQRQISIVSTGNAVPEPIDLSMVDTSVSPGAPHRMERYEGMLVTLVDSPVVAPTNRFDEFILNVFGTRSFREPGIEPDAMPELAMIGLPEWDLNPELFEVDPPEMGLDPVQITPGAMVTVVGGLAYAYQDYQIWPSELTVDPAEFDMRPVRAHADDEFTIATQNVENLFDLIDDPDRRDETFEDYVPDDEEAYNLRLGKISEQIRVNLGAPDVVAVQEIENKNVVADLIARINADDPDIVYAGCIYEGNDPRGIDNAFLLRFDRIFVGDCYQMPGTLTEVQFGNLPLYGRPPLVLDIELPASGENLPITLINLHIKSLSGIDTNDTQQRRLRQAEGIAAFVQSLQDEGRQVIVLGDMNAFQFTDGIVDVVNIIAGTQDLHGSLVNPGADIVQPDLVNQVMKVPEDDRYSYMYNGSYQVLDHILTTQGLDALVTDVQFSRGNADALAIWFEEDTGALRSSDHDGLVIYIKPG